MKDNLCEKCLWGTKTAVDGYKNIICRAKNSDASQVLGPYGGCSMYVKNDTENISKLSKDELEHLRSLSTFCYNRNDRKNEIWAAANEYNDKMTESEKYYSYPRGCFIDGAKWSDEHPKISKDELFATFIRKAADWIENNIPYDTDVDPDDLSGRDIVEYYDERQEYVDGIVKQFVSDMCDEFEIKRQ